MYVCMYVCNYAHVSVRAWSLKGFAWGLHARVRFSSPLAGCAGRLGVAVDSSEYDMLFSRQAFLEQHRPVQGHAFLTWVPSVAVSGDRMPGHHMALHQRFAIAGIARYLQYTGA